MLQTVVSRLCLPLVCYLPSDKILGLKNWRKWGVWHTLFSRALRGGRSTKFEENQTNLKRVILPAVSSASSGDLRPDVRPSPLITPLRHLLRRFSSNPLPECLNPPVVQQSWNNRLSRVRYSCLLIIDKTRATDKTYIWVSVWWKTKNWSWGIYTPRIHWVGREAPLKTIFLWYISTVLSHHLSWSTRRRAPVAFIPLKPIHTWVHASKLKRFFREKCT
jgi:hypothetical protein